MKIHSSIPLSGLPRLFSSSFARGTFVTTKKAALLLFSVAVLVAGGAETVRGQSALDGFDPNANDRVNVVVVQPDGKILIGGTFSSVLGVARSYIARLNPDGTLDTAFDPNANLEVISIALQADGKILAGGTFTNIGGQTRNRIARLDATTGVADSFDPNSSGHVFAIAVQADGKILVGGPFSTIGGQTRNNIARLDATTGLADSFDPNANNTVGAIAVQADGKILVGGNFFGANSIGGAARNNVARLDATTGLADSFDPNPGLGFAHVDALAVQADGKILAGGTFTNIGGQTRNNIARFDATTGLADSFDPNANSDPGVNSYALSIALQADGKILAGGHFTTLTPNGGATVTRNRIARLKTDGTLEQTLNLNTIGSLVTATAVQPDGKILIGGSFSSVLAVPRNNIARVNTDGTLDAAFNPNANGEVDAIAVQADGKILAGGFFTSIGGQARNFIARLEAATGAADAFDPNANSIVDAIAVQADGKVLAGGNFSGANSIGGQARNFIARLDPATGLADAFNPNANSIVQTIAVQADGKILAGGNFATIGGQPRSFIARLNATTGAADLFNPHANNQVHTIAVGTGGKILAGGIFTNIGGQPRNRIAQLDAAAGAADSFDANANNDVTSITVQADGKIMAGGRFTNIGGALRNFIGRLDPATSLADSFDANADSHVLSIAVEADGKILAGGSFTSIGGQPRSLFARLTNDTAALQNLAVTPTTITWTRGGSSSQFTRVTFEYSTDNVNYTLLGNSTPTGSNWTLTGLNLSTGQNIYIRARGYYRSGYFNGSESIAESVRNVFITLPPVPTQVVSRKTHGGAPFDITLPLVGSSGIECRSGGVTNDYQMVFSFPGSVTFTNASVTAGAGSVSGSGGIGTSTIVVNLTGVTNAQRLTVTLLGASDGTNTGDLSVQMGVLLGDTSGNGTVNASDVSQTKSKSGQIVDATNFRTDVTVNGSINASDLSLVKSRSGTALP